MWQPIPKFIPYKNVLVQLTEPVLGSKMHVARVHDGKIVMVAGCFHFDVPKPVAYQPLPDEYVPSHGEGDDIAG